MKRGEFSLIRRREPSGTYRTLAIIRIPVLLDAHFVSQWLASKFHLSFRFRYMATSKGLRRRPETLSMSKEHSPSLDLSNESSSESEKEYELDDFDIIKTIGKYTASTFTVKIRPKMKGIWAR